MNNDISIIILSYNHESFIEECLDSVLEQSVQPKEVVIVDDYSSDNSKTLIEGFIAKNNCPVRFISNTENLGNCKSFNQALEFVTSSYVIDLAGDDVLLPDSISLKSNFLTTWFKDCP